MCQTLSGGKKSKISERSGAGTRENRNAKHLLEDINKVWSYINTYKQLEHGVIKERNHLAYKSSCQFFSLILNLWCLAFFLMFESCSNHNTNNTRTLIFTIFYLKCTSKRWKIGIPENSQKGGNIKKLRIK